MDKVMRMSSEKGVAIFTKSSCCLCYAVQILFRNLGFNQRFTKSTPTQTAVRSRRPFSVSAAPPPSQLSS
ncbi:unnamed protein product [Brassica oleracea var. botrytis]